MVHTEDETSDVSCRVISGGSAVAAARLLCAQSDQFFADDFRPCSCPLGRNACWVNNTGETLALRRSLLLLVPFSWKCHF